MTINLELNTLDCNDMAATILSVMVVNLYLLYEVTTVRPSVFISCTATNEGEQDDNQKNAFHDYLDLIVLAMSSIIFMPTASIALDPLPSLPLIMISGTHRTLDLDSASATPTAVLYSHSALS